jgi:hypothetical protein
MFSWTNKTVGQCQVHLNQPSQCHHHQQKLKITQIIAMQPKILKYLIMNIIMMGTMWLISKN